MLDLFSGCGGVSQGFHQEGFDLLAAYDSWPQAVTCYGRNFDHPVYQQDVSDTITMIQEVFRRQPDIVVGSPPFPGARDAYARRHPERDDLTLAFAEIMFAARPEWFVFKSSPRVGENPVWAEARELLRAADYGITEIVLDAARCGAPQRRSRFFAIGRQFASDNFLLDALQNNLSDTQLTAREYLGDELEVEYYYRHPPQSGRRCIFTIDEPAPTVSANNAPVPEDLGESPDWPEPPAGLRALTPQERARLQTFPADYVFPWDDPQLADKMIAEAAPPALAAYVARAIRQYEAVLEGYE